MFNLFASAQNSLRQQIREQIFLTSRRRYLETFINDKQLAKGTASADFGVGMVTLPFVNETPLTNFTIESGVLSSGYQNTTFAYLKDGKAETAMVWIGAQVELVITFAEPTIVNRLRLELDDYQGLGIDLLACSPDGILIEDLLATLPASGRFVDGSSNKFSGDWVIDFDPRHIQSLRIVISDRVGEERIALRGLALSALRYEIIGSLQSKAIEFPKIGIVTFESEQGVSARADVDHSSDLV